MLSIVIIYSHNDKKYLEECIKTLPKWAEIIIAETIPKEAEKWTIYQTGEFGNIKRFDLCYPEEAFRFDKAYNIAKSKATQGWILIIHADERLVKNEEGWLREVLENTPEDVGAYWSTQWNYTLQGNTAERLATKIIKLFRNIPCLNFVYPVHELLREEHVIEAGYKVMESKQLIIHDEGYSYDTVRLIKKLKRNLEIIIKYWDEFQDEFSKNRYWYYLIESGIAIKNLGGIKWHKGQH